MHLSPPAPRRGSRRTPSYGAPRHHGGSARRNAADLAAMTPAFRAMRPDDIAEFCAGGSDDGLAARLARDIDVGTVRPEWGWLAMDGNRVVARHHWWGPAGAPAPIVLFPVDAADDDDDATVALVEHARDVLQVHDAWAEITIPGADGDPWRDRPRRVRLLESVGFPFSVDRVRVEWTGDGRDATAPSPRLTFAPAATLTEDGLVELF